MSIQQLQELAEQKDEEMAAVREEYEERAAEKEEEEAKVTPPLCQPDTTPVSA